MNERKGIVFTAIAVSLVGIVTGLFLGGGLLPSRPAVLQQYDERTTATTTTQVVVHSHDGISQHEHAVTTVVTTTETTPHGYFHDFAAAMAIPGTKPTSATSTPARGPYEVWAAGREFVPPVITVPVGTTVTWTNKDGIEHTVTSDDGLFAESITFQSFNYTFTERGTFRYSCEPHPAMMGTVIVK